MVAVLDFFYYVFLVSPVIALVLCGWIALSEWSWRVRGAVVGLTAVVVVATVGYWVLWGEAFDAADVDGVVPEGMRLGLNAAMWVGLVALGGLVGLTAVRVVAPGTASGAGKAPVSG